MSVLLGRKSHFLDACVSCIGAAVLVWLIPVNDPGASAGMTVIPGEHKCAVSVGRLTLGLAPDAADLVLGR